MTELPSVTLIHNYREEQQPSMRLYAERLGDALQRRHVDLRRVRPPGIVPDPWLRGSAAWNKIDAYAMTRVWIRQARELRSR